MAGCRRAGLRGVAKQERYLSLPTMAVGRLGSEVDVMPTTVTYYTHTNGYTGPPQSAFRRVKLTNGTTLFQLAQPEGWVWSDDMVKYLFMDGNMEPITRDQAIEVLRRMGAEPDEHDRAAA